MHSPTFFSTRPISTSVLVGRSSRTRSTQREGQKERFEIRSSKLGRDSHQQTFDFFRDSLLRLFRKWRLTNRVQGAAPTTRRPTPDPTTTTRRESKERIKISRNGSNPRTETRPQSLSLAQSPSPRRNRLSPTTRACMESISSCSQPVWVRFRNHLLGILHLRNGAAMISASTRSCSAVERCTDESCNRISRFL